MRNPILVCVLMVLLVSACTLPDSNTPPSNNNTVPIPPEQAADRPLLYIGIMVHLEGWGDDTSQEKFEGHAHWVRTYASLFETYGAVLTLESRELTDGSIRWGDNVLLEMQQRGHGVGVHADIGGQLNYDCSRFAEDLRTEKEQLESLGVEVRHVSGITSHCDWVTAAVEAGFEFTTGMVAYSVMSLPEELRPEEYRNCPNPGACHQTFPTELADRIHPWRVNSGLDWLTPDPGGEFVLLSASGLLTCRQEALTSPESFTTCEFTEEDITAAQVQLEEALALADPGKINILYYSWSLGGPLDETLLADWLESLEPYVVSGQVAWASLPEMYDAFLTWEAGQ
jgi:hypothetical protein